MSKPIECFNAKEAEGEPRGLELVRRLVGSLRYGVVLILLLIIGRFTVAAGYGHFGGVLNHNANSVRGITTKFEF